MWKEKEATWKRTKGPQPTAGTTAPDMSDAILDPLPQLSYTSQHHVEQSWSTPAEPRLNNTPTEHLEIK